MGQFFFTHHPKIRFGIIPTKAMKKCNTLQPCKGHESNPTVVYEPCYQCNKPIPTGTTQNIKATFKWPDGDEVQHYRWEFIDTPNEKITLI